MPVVTRSGDMDKQNENLIEGRETSMGDASNSSSQPAVPTGSGGSGSQSRFSLVPHNIQVGVDLKENGDNWPVWSLAFRAACELKGCVEAIDEPRPGSLENSAALLLLISCVPASWGNNLAELEHAHAAYKWVFNRYNGGINPEITAKWLDALHEKMRDDETLDQYYDKKMVYIQHCGEMGTYCWTETSSLQLLRACPQRPQMLV